jgi:hypothetical protein
MTLKEIPKDQIKDHTKTESVFIIVYQNAKYRLNGVSINKNISGDVQEQAEEPEGTEKFYQVFIYVKNDYELHGTTLNLPFEYVEKVEIYKLNGTKAAVFIGGTALIAVALIYAIFNTDMIMNSGLNGFY